MDEYPKFKTMNGVTYFYIKYGEEWIWRVFTEIEINILKNLNQ